MKVQLRGLRAAAMGASALTSLAAGHAFAQQAASTPAESSAIEEVVVTALKRSTTVQTTPISISAVTEKSLQAIGASGIQDYFRTVPNLQVDGNSPTSRRLTLRGVRSAGEATVGLYYDETPLTGPAGTTADASSTSADVNLFDAERVEVLRGPQGTLYGSGSMGGTLRVILNKPDTTRYAGSVEAQGASVKGGNASYAVKGMVNVPLIQDKLAARLVLYKAEGGGYIDDVLLNKKNINDQHSAGGRLMLGFTPTDKLTFTATGLFQKTTLDGQNTWYPALGAKDYSTNARTIAPTSDNLRMYNVTGKWDLGFATLTGTSSYYKWTLLRNSDYSPTLSANRANATSCRNYIAGGAPAAGTTNPACSTAQMAQYTAYADSRVPGALYQPMGLTSWNHELRLNGSLFDSKVDWTGGVYYEDRSDYIESKVAKADAATGVINPNDLTAWRHVGTDTKQTAFFGEIAYKPIDKLTLTVGARRFNYDKTVSGQVLISNFITQSYVGPAAQVDASASGWVSKVNVSYQVTSDVMVYALAAKGFRPGGANNVPGLSTALLAYAPDSLWNYEAGVKSQWFDRRLTLNAAAYQIDWSNMQISATSANGAFSYLTNAGTAKIKGFEVEATARPMRGLTISGTGAIVDAKLTQDQANSTILITGSTGLRGDAFPNVAKYSGSASVEYSWPLTGDLNGLLRADYAYVGKSASQFRPTYVYYEKQGDYGYANLRAGVEGPDWGAYLFVNNITNEVGLMSVTSALNNPKQVVSINPRTAGFQVRKRF